MERIVENRNAVIRHSLVELTEHWFLAISGFFLIFSGFGEFPMYKRFMVTQIPGLGWAGDFWVNLKIHYLAGIVFVSVMAFHTVYHGCLKHQGLLPKRGDIRASFQTILGMFGFGEEPKSHKYLPEQRLAYAYLWGTGLVLVLTGILKVIKNLPGAFLSPTFVTWTTLIHTFFTFFFLLGVLAHLAALVFRVNRPLVKSILTGEVNLDYVRGRHTLWYNELRRSEVTKIDSIEFPVQESLGNRSDQETPEAPGQDMESRPPSPPCGAGEGIEEQEDAKMQTVFKVKGMTCQHCVMSVKKALGKLEGIQNVDVDLQRAEVRLDNTKGVASDLVKKAIEEAGYEVVPA